jgi:hypothetical protein
LDPSFNVFVGQVGFWLPWDPAPSEIQNQEYAEDQLNTLMKNYKENEVKKDEFFEEQKRERLSNAKVRTGNPSVGPTANPKRLRSPMPFLMAMILPLHARHRRRRMRRHRHRQKTSRMRLRKRVLLINI